MTSCDLSEEVVFHILSWLPVKSLVRFNCVCKSWRALIKNSSFISKHLHHSAMNNKNNGGLLVKSCTPCPTFFLLSGETLTVLGNLDTPACFKENGEGYKIHQAMMSCNGIICFCSESYYYGRDLDVTLWNPATREIKALPKSGLADDGFGSDAYQFGFGFDVKTNDYKVLRSVCHKKNSGVAYISRQIEIYSVSSGSCRVISAFLPSRIDSQLGLYWNGSCYWLAGSFDKLLWFDMSDEIFQTRPLPAACAHNLIFNASNDHYYVRRLTVINDSVAVVLFPVDSERHLRFKDGIPYIETWVLKECWTQLYKVDLTPDFHGWPLEAFKEGHLFFRRGPLTGNYQIDLYDLATLEKKSSMEAFMLMQIVTYQESLVSLEERK